MNPDDERPVDLDDSEAINSPETEASPSFVAAQELNVGDWATIEGRIAHLEVVRREEDVVIVLTGRERVALPYGTLCGALLVQRLIYAPSTRNIEARKTLISIS